MNYKIILINVLLVIIGSIFAFQLSTDKPAAALTALSTGLAAISVLVSVNSAEESHKQTEKTLRITEKTFKLTEIEQKIRDIEKRLELFYYPVSHYFRISQKSLKGGLTDEDRRDLIQAESFRYLADEETRNQIEIWRNDKTTKAESQGKLIECINKDIEKYQNQIQELNNKKDSIEKEAKRLD